MKTQTRFYPHSHIWFGTTIALELTLPQIVSTNARSLVTMPRDWNMVLNAVSILGST
jgi:hypothetical protein